MAIPNPVPVGPGSIGRGRPLALITGPCVMEPNDLTLTIADRLAAICGDLGVPWSVVDVDADPELRAEYGDQVPVILIDGKQHGYWKVEEARLRALSPAKSGRLYDWAYRHDLIIGSGVNVVGQKRL